MKKYTLKELKEKAKKVYPKGLKKVEANKYKVEGFEGYLLLDNLTASNKVPNLFYNGKWRQDDLNIILEEIDTSDLFPLEGKLPSNFNEAVAVLERPYVAINREQYEEVFEVGCDFFKYQDKVVTFGNADGGFALMPLKEDFAKQILGH